MALFPSQVLTVLIACLILAESARLSNQPNLLEDLFKKYDPRVPPVLSPEGPVPVQFGIALVDIFEDRDNVFEIDAWLKMSWEDPSLRWDPEKYRGRYGNTFSVKILPVVHGQSPVIWMPDVVLYRGRIEDKLGSASPIRAVITYDGEVMWIPPRTLRVPCEPDQLIVEPGQARNVTCTLKFGSWVHNARELDLQDRGNKTVDIQEINYGKWTLAEFKHERIVRRYPCCVEEYISILVTLKLTETCLYPRSVPLACGNMTHLSDLKV